VAGIDLSLNRLAGAIPDEITSLSLLTNINLSSNHLSAQIPKNIGSMKSLESLDVSKNNLSGEIQPSLSDLTYLSYLDVSYNNLTGTIPSGRQLDTLYTENPSMYYGNSGLCGPPLQRNCSGSGTLEHGHGNNQHESEKDSDSAFFTMDLGQGLRWSYWFCSVFYYSRRHGELLISFLLI
jgi:Leucine-rich repeat (LRR) protein